MTVLPEETVDAFHGGRFWLAQPRKGGHRAGMDALVLAAAAPAGFRGVVADFGAGAGAVGLAVLARCPDARALLVERSDEMAGYARRSLALEGNTAIAARAVLIAADVTLAGAQRTAAGLADRSADFVLMNPPFNDPRDRATPNPMREAAHVGAGSVFDDWLRSAAAVVRKGGGVALIARPASLNEILTALERRFGGARIMPIHADAAQPAIRIVVRATRGSRERLALDPPLVLHQGSGQGFTERATAINAGLASLFGD